MPGPWALLVIAAGLVQASAERRGAPEASVQVTAAQVPEPALELSELRAVVERAIGAKTFPGCFIEVGSSRRVLWREGFGALDSTRPQRPTARSVYDLASVTKVVSTSLVVMALVDAGALRLDAPVTDYIPEFAEAGRDRERRRWRRRVTVEQLLTHSAGLADWLPLYDEARDYAGVVQGAVRAPLERRPGARTLYSDLDFILLGELVARATGRALVELEREHVFAPLGLVETRRGPLPADMLARAAATSERPEGDFWRGIVEDRNARTAGGVTGHAGLFSTSEELGALARALLRAHAGDDSVFASERLREFTTRRRLVPGSSFALGWDTPTRGLSTAGDHISRAAFGHTGWTGTSLWIDPKRDAYVVLLSNRVHPRHTRAGRRAMYQLRRAVHDAVFTALDDRAPSP